MHYFFRGGGAHDPRSTAIRAAHTMVFCLIMSDLKVDDAAIKRNILLTRKSQKVFSLAPMEDMNHSVFVKAG
jgi:hypothetical protein